MSFFDASVDAVRRLKPGWRILLDLRSVRLAGFAHNDADFTVADRILENIVGSAYEFRYYEDYPSCGTVFERLMKPREDGLLSYVSPDRRDFYDKQPNGLYRRKPGKWADLVRDPA